MSKTRAQVLLNSADTAQNLSLWLQSQKPTASFLQHRGQFPSIWGLRDAYTAVSELCVPLSSAVSAQEAAQLGFNCISTQLVQTPLRPTLQDLKWSLEQSQPRMHQSPLHTHKVLESSHPCSWGTNQCFLSCW